MKDDIIKFKKRCINILFDDLFELTPYRAEGVIDEAIQFGRENPETCKYDLYEPDYNVYQCSKCDEVWILENGNPKENNMEFCPFCGRKIIYEKK